VSPFLYRPEYSSSPPSLRKKLRPPPSSVKHTLKVGYTHGGQTCHLQLLPDNRAVPSPIRKTVVNSWGHSTDSVWKSIFPSATWPLLVAQRASNDIHPSEDRLQSSKRKPKRRGRNNGMGLEDRPLLELNAAGIDLGARETFVAVSPGRDDLNSLRAVYPGFLFG
jgi:hypothetical protein